MIWASAETPRPGRWRIAVWIAVACIVVLALGLSLGTSSAAWCGSCHAMRPFADGQARTKHAGVSCARCHAASADSYASLVAAQAGTMLPRFVLTLGAGEVTGPVNATADTGCRSCHAAAIGSGTVEARGLRIAHATCAVGRSCNECHASASHGRATRAARGFSMDVCVRCHDGTKVSAACDLCHAEKLPTDRIARGPWATTHGPRWETTHGLGDKSTCRVCHPSDYCRRCHKVDLPHSDGFPRTHGKDALKARAECVKCHDEKSFCTPCHGMQMPHPAGFLPKHSKVARGYRDEACSRCHPADTCDACHTAHTHPGRTEGALGTISIPRVVD